MFLVWPEPLQAVRDCLTVYAPFVIWLRGAGKKETKKKVAPASYTTSKPVPEKVVNPLIENDTI